MLNSHAGSAGEAYESVRGLLPQFGITRVADVTGLDWLGIPVWIAVRPLSKNLTVSQGKGLDHDAARASAVFESIELSVAEKCNDQHYKFQFVGNDLITGAHVLVDNESVAVNFACASSTPGRPSFNHSNGLASARSAEAAILQALLELAEREIRAEAGNDSTLFTSLTRLDEWKVLQKFPALLSREVQLNLWSLTSEWGVHCVVARLWSADFPVACLGSGAHVDPEVAAVRALTEAAQSRLTSISGGRDDVEIPASRYFSEKDSYVDGAENSMTFTAWIESNRKLVSSDWIERTTFDLASRCRELIGVGPVVVKLHDEDGLSVVRVFADGARFAGNVITP